MTISDTIAVSRDVTKLKRVYMIRKRCMENHVRNVLYSDFLLSIDTIFEQGLMQLLFTHFVGLNWICRTSQ